MEDCYLLILLLFEQGKKCEKTYTLQCRKFGVLILYV